MSNGNGTSGVGDMVGTALEVIGLGGGGGPIGNEPALTFATQEIQPPTNIYVTIDDVLNITMAGNASGALVQVTGRFLSVDGSIKPFEFDFTPPANRTLTGSTFNLSDGFLLSICAQLNAPDTPNSLVFITVSIFRGITTGPVNSAVLIQGYLFQGKQLAWPNSTLESPLAGPGTIRSITGTTPGAGSNILETVPTDAYWAIQSVTFTLATGVAPGNRQVGIILDDGVNGWYTWFCPVTQAASLTYRYTFAHNLGILQPAVQNNTFTTGLPEVRLAEAYRWGTTTANMGVGDQYSAPQYSVEEWVIAS